MIISPIVKNQYKQLCPNSWNKCNGDEEQLQYKIKRASELGKVVHNYENGSIVIRYYFLNFLVDKKNNIVMTMWKDKEVPKFDIEEDVKGAHKLVSQHKRLTSHWA